MCFFKYIFVSLFMPVFTHIFLGGGGKPGCPSPNIKNLNNWQKIYIKKLAKIYKTLAKNPATFKMPNAPIYKI